MRVLITGGAGFIGSNFVHYMLDRYSDIEIVVLDKLTYAGRLENLQDVMDRITFIRGNICEREDIERAGSCSVVFNFAAETHVDRSITDAGVFVNTDVFGTYNLLEYVRRNDDVEKYIQISTDEVYGYIKKGSFSETDSFRPSNPYSASKAGADLICQAYYKTYGLPVVIVRPSNNFGCRQFPEKFIPRFTILALQNKRLPLFGDGLQQREWLYVLDCVEAVDLLMQKSRQGEAYNVGGGRENEKTNLWVAKFILKQLKKSEELIEFVRDRPGHDVRYSLDSSKIKKLGWKPKWELEDALKETIQWYIDNPGYWHYLIEDKFVK